MIVALALTTVQLQADVSELQDRLEEVERDANTAGLLVGSTQTEFSGNLQEFNSTLIAAYEQVNLLEDKISKVEDQTQELNSTTEQLSVDLLAKIGQVANQSSQELNESVNLISTELNYQYGNLSRYVLPLASCRDLPPGSRSGYYLLAEPDGTSVEAYCDMTLNCSDTVGGWTRVVQLDMTNSSHQCPVNFRERSDGNLRTCSINTDEAGCYSVNYPVISTNYSLVCGRIIAYQIGSMDTFGGGSRPSQSIDDNFLDGIVLTHGSPRRHIWSFAAGLDEFGTSAQYNCLCTNVNLATVAVQPPLFLGGDYFCDTGAERLQTASIIYSGNPLWDGAGCGRLNSCCSFNRPPWFYKGLRPGTTDDIEMRVCRDEVATNEDIAIQSIDIYVQ